MRTFLTLSLLAPLTAAVVLDRIAIIALDRPIKASDIEREIRVTAFLNGDKPDFSTAGRKQAANRLIDQAIIRREIELGAYPEAGDKEVSRLLAETIRSRPQLAQYGVTEEQLRRALRWQITVLRFIEQRFQPRGQGSSEDPFITWLDQARKSAVIRYKEPELK
jgi:hypothetical protein